MPDASSDARAVFFKLAGIAATPQMVAPVGFGEHVVVVGLGMVGNLAAQLCRVAGTWTVNGADHAPGRLATARACGIDAWDISDRSLAEWIAAELAASGGAHYVVEAVGFGATVRD